MLQSRTTGAAPLPTSSLPPGEAAGHEGNPPVVDPTLADASKRSRPRSPTSVVSSIVFAEEKASHRARKATIEKIDEDSILQNIDQLLEVENYDNVKPLITEAIKIGAQSARIYTRLGRVLIQQGKYGEALETLELALSKEKRQISKALIHLYLGYTLHNLARIAKSDRHFQTAKRLYPDIIKQVKDSDKMLVESRLRPIRLTTTSPGDDLLNDSDGNPHD